MKNKQDHFAIFKQKVAIRFFGNAILSVVIVIVIYFFILKGRVANWIVYILESIGRMEHEEALLIYHYNFREYKEIFFVLAIVVIFLILIFISKRFGEWDIKLMKNKQDDFAIFQRKIAIRFLGNALLSVAIVIMLYLFLWKKRFGNWIVYILETIWKMEHEEAYLIYHHNFREHKEIFFAVAIVVIFLILILLLFRWLTKYFREINLGIESLLSEDEKKICLSPEMYPFEYKLNTVKQNLKQQKEATALAEQRKDELVMYLAHDIRTPLTSVIGYLSLLEEEPDMTKEERIKNIHIALDKSYRLDKMVNEFFEITHYHSKQIKLKKQLIDLYYMLVQLRDEFLPSFSLRNNTVLLEFDENMTIYADPEKIVRVFGNMLKNAVAYSYPNTKIIVSAMQSEQYTIITFQNSGKTLPAEKLSSLFDKFYRLDEARISDTGGTGLGLAIAKEIVLLHGGTIEVQSEHETVTFIIQLPIS